MLKKELYVAVYDGVGYWVGSVKVGSKIGFDIKRGSTLRTEYRQNEVCDICRSYCPDLCNHDKDTECGAG